MDVWTACCVSLGWAAAALLGVCGWLWMNRTRTNIPGPTPLPLLGNVLYFRKLPVVLEHFTRLHRRYGDVFRIYAGPKLIIVATRPEDAQRLLAGSRMRDRDAYTMAPLMPYMGDGLVTSKGDIWKTHRRLIEPTFHPEVLGKLTDAFNDGALFICEQLAQAGGKEADVTSMFIQAALRTLTFSMFGLTLDEMEPDLRKQLEFANEFTESLKISQKRIFFPWLQLEWVLSLTPDGRAFRRQVNLLNSLVKRGIAFKRENRGSVMHSKRKTFLDVMIDPQGELLLPEEEVHDEIRTFTIAGTETVATAVSYALALLGLHPEWQDEAHRELDAFYGTGGDYLRPSTADDLAQLPIIDSIIKETLRLYPTIPNASVTAPEDVPLADGRYVAPRGSCVLVALCLMHRQPDIFPEPDKFDPGRFLEGGSAGSSHPYSYLPFGAGSRKCIGFRFATMQLKTVLAAVLRRFRVLPGSSRQELENMEISISGKPTKGFRITCVPRDLPLRTAT